MANHSCQQWVAGRHFESVLLETMQQNSNQAGAGDNAYLRKTFHAMLNRYRDSEYHRIGWHSDIATFKHDPITTFNWGATGVLLMRSKRRGATVEKVLVILPGDAYICGGAFQANFDHARPPIPQWAGMSCLSLKSMPWRLQFTIMRSELTGSAVTSVFAGILATVWSVP